MQKIRNRISAQESRDRKKNQFNHLVTTNISLIENAIQVNQEMEALKLENRLLKEERQAREDQQSLLNMDSFLSPMPRHNSKGDWRSFSVFILTMLVYSILSGDKNSFSERLNAPESILSASNEKLSESVVGKIELLCNEFAQKHGIKQVFALREKLFGRKASESESSLLNLQKEEPEVFPVKYEFGIPQEDLEKELKLHYLAYFQNRDELDDPDSEDQEATKSQSSSLEDSRSFSETDLAHQDGRNKLSF